VLVARTDIDAGAIARFDAHRLDEERALAAYDEAVGAVSKRYADRAGRASGAAAEVLVATSGLARDKGLRSAVRKELRAGKPLLDAVQAAVDTFAGMLSAMGGVMAERVTDLRDIGLRVTAEVVGAPEPGVPTPQEPSVLVAEDLAPADTAGLDASLVVALVTEKGGATSHTAIIARQLGIPCVVGVAGATSLPAGALVLVDGTVGTIDLGVPDDRARELVEHDREQRAALARWTGPAATSDGIPVKVLANVADGTSAATAAAGPVEGVGLFRTELCFLDRADEPSIEEQADVYGRVLAAYADGRHVVVRTLDAGSDKPIGYATLAGEQNPALGVRGLRLSFGNPGMLDRQLDAIALAAEQTGTRPWVMAPMVATVEEAADFAGKVRGRGLPAGAMVEVPSAALLAEHILAEVDFLSIGTNDLTQYAMAADRLAAELAHLTDPWQPAVLRLVAMTAEAGQRVGKPVGVCGEAAADPMLATVLVGMGVTSLSMAEAAVRAVGAQVGLVDLATCRAAATAALTATSPAAARAAVQGILRPAG
jgi:phosphotransferase system enzyme I (PtsI)